MFHSDLTKLDYVTWRKFLSDADLWDKAQQEQHQLKRLQQILTISQRTLGYQNLYRGLDIQIKELQDIRRLPLTSRKLFQTVGSTLFCAIDGFSDATEKVTTGGSTGTPLALYHTKREFHRELASKAHQYSRIGWCEGERQVVLRGLVQNETHYSFHPEYNELRLSSYHLNDELILEQYWEAINRFRPEWIKCYPSSGFLLASWMRENVLELTGVRGILCASENLYERQANMLRSAFPEATVFSHYGHYELAALGGYCEYDPTYHMLPFYGYTELLNPAGDPVTERGEIGEIVATSFITEAMPIIRYKTGDLAKFVSNSCPHCGRPYMILESIEGRTQDFLVNADGQYISLTALNFHDDTFENVLEYQFIQSEPGVIAINCVLVPGEDINDIRIRVQERLSCKLGRCTINIYQVLEIGKSKRGKAIPIIQSLANPYWGHDE